MVCVPSENASHHHTKAVAMRVERMYKREEKKARQSWRLLTTLFTAVTPDPQTALTTESYITITCHFIWSRDLKTAVLQTHSTGKQHRKHGGIVCLCTLEISIGFYCWLLIYKNVHILYIYIYIYMFSHDLIYVCVYVYIHTHTHTWTLFSGITATRWVGTWFNTGAEPREGFVVTLEESNRVDRAVVRNCKARKTNLSNEKMIMPQHDWGKKSRSFDQLCSMLPLPWHKRKSVILHNLVVDTRAHTHIHITEYLSNLLLSPQNSITTLHNW